jgi:purine-binding chemotaxis protein CheW
MIEDEIEIKNNMNEVKFVEYEKYLTFTISKQVYCIKIESVSDMIAIREIKEVLFLPAFVKGVINLKGRIIPVIDLIRMQYDLNKKDQGDWIYLVIVKVRNTYVGLKVDSIHNIVSLSESEIDTIPHFSTSVMGIGKIKDNSKIILDAEEILPLKELMAIKENIEQEIRPVIN